MRTRLDPVLPPLLMSPRITKRLPHDARRIGWGREGDVALVIGSDSRFSVVDAELEVVVDGEVRNADLRAGVVDADASGGGQLAFAARAAFILSDFGATSVSTHTHRAWQPHEGGDVRFLEDGRIVCVCPGKDGAPAVQLRDPASGLVHEEASARFPPNARFRLVATPDPEAFLIEVVPLGVPSSVFLLHVDEAPHLREAPALAAEGAGPLVFGPDGVAARVTQTGVERWRWVGGELLPLDRWNATDDASHLEGAALHPELVPLGPDQLLVAERDGARFHLLDVASMRLALPVLLEALKPPLNHLLGEPAGDRILLAHGDDGVLLSLLEPPFGEVS
ncbi:MAG: hypothetical protein AB8I08_05590 [Sandaracinaceae bacterium]